MGTDTFQLVVAITLASVLSHISLLLILGRRDELYRGVDMLTNALAGDSMDINRSPDNYDYSMRQRPQLPYPMYDNLPVHIPQAVPAGHSSWGPPLDWQNPALGASSHSQRQPLAQNQGYGAKLCQNYYL